MGASQRLPFVCASCRRSQIHLQSAVATVRAVPDRPSSFSRAILKSRPSYRSFQSNAHSKLAAFAEYRNLERQNVKGAVQQETVESSENEPEALNAQQLLNLETSFSLCDAMRYIKAFEAGYPPGSAKYDIAVCFKTPKNAPTIKNRVVLPHSVASNQKIFVLCPPDSPLAEECLDAGATMTGEDDILNDVKAGKIAFDVLICHVDSVDKLNRAKVAQLLGKKRLMPTIKNGLLTRDVLTQIKLIAAGAQYREKRGMLQLAVGTLSFTPEQLQDNIKAVMKSIIKDAEVLDTSGTPKSMTKVTLSSTRAPGFHLTGNFRSEKSPSTTDLSIS